MPGIDMLIVAGRKIAGDSGEFGDVVDKLLVNQLPAEFGRDAGRDLRPSAAILRGDGEHTIFHLVITVGTTDIPGRNRCSGSCPLSKTIFTGTRCTTLT